MTKAGYTHIQVVLDRSGSMVSCAQAMKEGYDAFLASQRELSLAEGLEATIGLVQFDDYHEIVYGMTTLDEHVPGLMLEPRGSTALLDAMADTIDDLGDTLARMHSDARPEHVIFVTITDGMENRSRVHDRPAVLDRIVRQRKDFGWEFVFLGANQDAIATGAAYGIDRGSSMSYGTSRGETHSAYAAFASNVSDVRTGAKDNIDFSEEERAASKTGSKS
jgi:hypothetical protein